ncbi:MAG: hypothetical protein U5L96_03365 [Owenweeksia sp.]|nr:hypothetical protein [Owenweeksia sp.]
MSKIARIALMALLIVVSLSFLTYYTYDGMSDDSFQIVFNDDYNIYALNIPEQLSFGGEEVPMADPEIRERLDREYASKHLLAKPNDALL